MKSIIKKAVFILSACLIIVLTIVPCFASRGDITTTSIKGDWELKYHTPTDSRVLEPYSFICTQEISDNMQGGNSDKPPQVMSDQTGTFGYREIYIDMIDGLNQWQGVAHYSFGLGTRGFTTIVLGYTFPNEEIQPIGQEMTLSCIYLANYGEYTNDGRLEVVDYLMIMLDYSNVVWSRNLDCITFSQDYLPIYIDSGNIATQNQAMKVFGTNAFGGAVLNTGAFVPVGTDPTPPASDTLESFVDLVFNTLTAILSIEFFGWFSLGALVAVFVAISAVLLFLKYFAGG